MAYLSCLAFSTVIPLHSSSSELERNKMHHGTCFVECLMNNECNLFGYLLLIQSSFLLWFSQMLLAIICFNVACLNCCKGLIILSSSQLTRYFTFLMQKVESLFPFVSSNGWTNWQSCLSNLQIFNEFNARKPDEINVFTGVTKNYIVIGTIGTTFIFQVICQLRYGSLPVNFTVTNLP